jgi:DNA-binding transcriptional LysR family regulator
MPSPAAASELRLADIATFLAVVRTGSVTATARELRVTPSQVSKAIVRLEKYVRTPLLARKSRGVTATDDGRDLLPRLQELLESARVLPERAARDELFTVAAPSYLATTLVPSVAGALDDIRLRTVEAGEAFIRAYAGDDVFQLALTLSAQTLTRAWSSTKAGAVRQSFFAAPSVAAKLGTTVTREQLRKMKFVMPVYHSAGQFLPGEDGCPIARAERIAGHEVPTVAIALEIASITQQIAYGPEIAARAHVADGRLVELHLKGDESAVDVYLHVNQDRVLARTRTRIMDALAAALPEKKPEKPGKKRSA